jgi:hypothetical protein
MTVDNVTAIGDVDEGRIVARLRLPMPADALTGVSGALEEAYGQGLVVMDSPAGWLLIGTPQGTRP